MGGGGEEREKEAAVAAAASGSKLGAWQKEGRLGRRRPSKKLLHIGAACRRRTEGGRMDEQTEHAVFVENILLPGV